jgi:hypothetical protein
MSREHNKSTYSSIYRSFSFFDKVATKKRKEIVYSAINSDKEIFIDLDTINSILDVGTTLDESLTSSNIILKILAPGKRVTSLSDQGLDNRQSSLYFIDEYILGDITREDFSASRYDLVTCSAVLEHCGDKQKQFQAIANLLGVADKYLLLTIPNRWYPIELHSKLPLIHYLPKKLYRALYSFFGYGELALEENLNYISCSSVLEQIRKFDPNLQVRVERIWTFGFCSNFLFLVKI